MSQSVIDKHLSQFEPDQRAALEATCAVVRRALPGADEVISYGMPTFKVDGVAVLGLDGFKAHNSLFPYSGAVIGLVSEELPDLHSAKGTVQFDRERPFPAALLKRIVKLRITEINEGYPKKSGETKEYYDNGFLKLKGKTKAGQMHGNWQWFRRDGSLMRSGSFKDGVQVGEWTTYDRNGEPVKVTHY